MAEKPKNAAAKNEVFHGAVGGCLAYHADRWYKMFGNIFQSRTVERGFSLTFKEGKPPPLSKQPVEMKPKRDQHDLISPAIQELIQKEALEVVEDPSSPGWYSRIFMVPKSSGGLRTVIDLSRLNRFLAVPKFRMTKFSEVTAALSQGQWAASIDLKDAYFQVPIHPRARKFFRIAWQGKVYQFRALPFGLSPAPWLFTELVRPLVAWAQERGVRMFAYLDDWLIVADTKSECRRAVGMVLEQAVKLGFRINTEKSELEPSQVFVFLGMEYDLILGVVRPTVDRIQKIQDRITELLGPVQLSARTWLRVQGLLNSSYSMITLGRLRGRPVQRYLASVWHQASESLEKAIPSPSDPEVRTQFRWWLDPIRLREGVSLQPLETPVNLFTDASHYGWGGHLDSRMANGAWTPLERRFHINILEMWAVEKSLLAFRNFLTGSHVHLSTDNATVLAYLKNEGGTHSYPLLEGATKILLWCQHHKITLTASHLAGKLNVLADALSRADKAIPTEWSLKPHLASRVREIGDMPLLDLFATRRNKRAPMFVSPFPDPLAWAVDALSFKWDALHAYAFPPFPLINEVLEKVASSDNCRIVLVAPKWSSQRWYPKLLQLLVDHPREIPISRDVVSQPGFRSHPTPEWLSLHAWPLSSNPSLVEVFLSKQPVFLGNPPGNHQQSCMIQNGSASLIGVVKGRKILSRPLFSR